MSCLTLSYSTYNCVQYFNRTTWIFIQEDGLYTFNPSSLKTEFQVEIPDTLIYSADISYDGTIYFMKFNPEVKLDKGDLHIFNPKTKMYRLIDNPSETWPGPGYIFVDHTGNLWLDTIGYRDTSGSWNLLYPDVELFLSNIVKGGGFNWITPHIMLESSNGIFWVAKHTEINSGTAWYDPETGEGCWFTNIPLEIVEDSQKNLWLVSNDILYSYSLNP